MRYRAPWSRSVMLITVGIIALVGAVGALVPAPVISLLIWGMIPGLAVFGVRGYSLESDTLVIHRPFHRTRVPLRDLVEVRVDPRVTSGSIRLFGNGGVFGFSGLFRNATLGNYRAWMTDPGLAVVLRTAEETWVVSPDRPHLFAEEVREQVGLHDTDPA